MMGTTRRAAWIPILLLSSACVSARVPPHAAESRWGVVHADDSVTAEEYVRVLDDVAPFVARSLPGLEVEPVDLRVVGRVSRIFETTPPAEPVGAVFDAQDATWIEIRSGAEPRETRRIMAHELVHRWLGPHWKPLPPALEDGLCEAVAHGFAGDESPRERMLRFLSAWITLNGELSVDHDGRLVEPGSELSSFTIRGEFDRMTAADLFDSMQRDQNGYFSIEGAHRFGVVNLLSRLLISRLTIDRLFELCVTAEERGLELVPPEWIFEAAGLDPLDPSAWNELLLRTYGEPERRTLRAEAPIPWGLIKPTRGEFPVTIHVPVTVSF